MSPGTPSAHRAGLEALGLPPPASAALAAYLDLLARWGARTNLSGAGDPGTRIALLVAPVLGLARLLEPGTLLDVGSGNGSPGLVLALLRPDLATTLLEPRARRWAFLREAARGAGRADVRVLRLRHDAYPGPPADNVTLRGLRLPLAELAGLVRVGGRLILLGGAPVGGGPFRVEAPPQGARLLLLRRTGDPARVPRET